MSQPTALGTVEYRPEWSEADMDVADWIGALTNIYNSVWPAKPMVIIGTSWSTEDFV